MRNKRGMAATAALVGLAALVAACSSEAGPGEACDEPGGTADVCESGTVCGRPTDKATGFACISICLEDKDCAPGHDCKGVDGTSLKGCRYTG